MKYKDYKILIVMAIIITTIMCILCTNITMSQNTFAAVEETKNKKILIDPGHGGIDGGAVSRTGTLEKDINLSLSLMLREELKKEGFQVIMTREEDKGLYTDSGRIRKKKIEDLSNRCKMKNDTNCDLFISIHLNMFPEARYYGAQVWYGNCKESEKLAHIIQTNMREKIDISNKRQEKPANNSYKILRCNENMPSVIVECGFLSNPMEEAKLKSKEYQNSIAKVLCESVKMYFSEND